jgi:hypothetical protein
VSGVNDRGNKGCICAVWVLEAERGYEGSSLAGVFSTRDLAVAALSWDDENVSGYFLSEVTIDAVIVPGFEYHARPNDAPTPGKH